MTAPAESMIDGGVLCHECRQTMRACQCEHSEWKEGDELIALYSGVVDIPGFGKLTCHVLNNGQRVFDCADIERVLLGLEKS